MAEIIGFILWIASIFICMYICEKKGRTVWKGALAGFLIGWVGIIVCAFLDNKNTEE